MNQRITCLFLMSQIVAALSTFAAPIKVGIIGLDAHAVPWTQIIHGPKAPPPISDLRIVAAVPAPSADIPFSQDNIEKNTARMRELGVEICDTIEAMLLKVDAVMVLSVDGRPHLRQAHAWTAGRSNRKQLPWPTTVSMAAVVPWASRIIFTSVRPSPVPP